MVGTILSGLVAIAAGLFGVMGLFWGLNWVTDRLGPTWSERVKPWVFFGPAFLVVTVFLIYPFLDTIRRSFYADRFSQGERPFVGFDNYTRVLNDDTTWSSLWNNLLWVIVVPLGAVVVGLIVAVLADRLSQKWENVTKALIFLPMAISFVGASAIWLLVYQIEPAGEAQTGVLNAIFHGLGLEPVDWIRSERINDFALMMIMIWLQAGFAMVLLSAAIKNVPYDTIEAARIDGASELQVFFRVVIPQIMSSIVVVLTTILILVLKVFDIVRVMTNGRNGTEVVANFFFTKFENGAYGTAGVLVVILVILTIPFMIINIRRFREQEAMR
jgi:alpha-glucoside transport system permease protein